MGGQTWVGGAGGNTTRPVRAQGTLLDPDGVWIAAAIEKEVLVLHVRKSFRVERHADKVEIGIEAVDLDGYVDVVARGTVTVVVDVLIVVARHISLRVGAPKRITAGVCCLSKTVVDGWN